MIVEETVAPKVTDPPSELLRGLAALPALDGYVLTGPRGGTSQTVLATDGGDPILAAGQMGLGRAVAFTSSADARWAARWLAWGGHERFWEQAVRWASRSAQPSEVEIFADVQGRNVILSVEALATGGAYARLAEIGGQVIAPDFSAQALALRQVGPGRYRASFTAGQSGSYLVHVHYRAADADGAAARTGRAQAAVIVPYAPEFRDLSDNAALLADVAATTGGRVLGDDAVQAGLFRRQDVRMPATATPLTVPLLAAWLGLFLLDVAVRRLAVDFRAIARRAVALVRRRAARPADATLERLKARHKRLREQMAPGAGPARMKHFDAGGRPAGPLPAADVTVEPPPDRRPATPATPAAPAPPEDKTHLDRLLRAKRKARGSRDEPPDSQSGET